MKLKLVMGVVATGVWLWSGVLSAHGQKATEIFIPVGQSPGMSNKVTVIGTIEAVDARARTIAIAGSGSATITNHTKIWLDKSKLKQTSQTGSFADLEQGLLVEVRYVDPEGRAKGKGPAEWVKVQVTEPGAKTGETRQ